MDKIEEIKCEVCGFEVLSPTPPTFFGSDAGREEEAICSTCFKWSLYHWGRELRLADNLARFYKAGAWKARMLNAKV